jgi:uncharacterized protein
MNLPPFLKPSKSGVTVAVKVQPRAPRNQVVGIEGAELKIKIAAPPVDSAANEALEKFLAEILNCPRSGVSLLRGHTARHKLVGIVGVSPETAAARLTP